MRSLLRNLLVIASIFLTSEAFAGSGTIGVTPGSGATISTTTDGSGNHLSHVVPCDASAGANCQTVKAASTAPAAADPALVVSIGPNGLLPAFAATPAFTISGTLPAFASTPTVNLGTLNGAATAAGVATVNTTLGTPMQNSGGTVGISGTLPAFASTPTVNAAQSGTWTVQPGNTANTTAWKVDGSAVTQPVSGTVTANAGTNLNTSALATSANLTGGAQKTQIVDGSGSVIASTSNNLNVQCANCSGSGVSTADQASFTAGTSLFAGSGGFFQTTPTSNPLTTGQQGVFQVTANRALFSNLRNAAGTEVGTSGAPIRTDTTGSTTQPVSGTVTANAGTNLNTSLLALESGGNLATLAGAITANVEQANVKQINGVAPLMGNGATGTGSQRVTIASDNTAFAVNAAAAQSGTWTVQPGNTANTTAWKVDGSAVTQPISAAALPLPTLASTSTKQSDGTQKTQIVDGSGSVIASTSNNLNVQCANCSGSGVSTADAATFTASTSLFAGSGAFFQTTPTANALTNGKQGMFQATANRALFVNLRDAAGGELGTFASPLTTLSNLRNAAGAETGIAALPLRTDPVGTTTQPVSAASLPLPSGASTSAKQPALGTAGAASADVLSIQGIASMTKLLVTPDSVALPANQSVNVSQFNGVTALMGNGATGTGSPRVTIASDNTAFSVNANAGTNLNTSALALESGGNLATIATAKLAQGSTTSGQKGDLTMGAVTTAAPTYTTAQTSPISLTTAGAIRTDSNTSQINGVAPLMGNGVSGTGAQRVAIASDNTAFSVNLGTIGGAATAAKQPALGTAGTSSADVITIQGRASMTPVLVDGSATQIQGSAPGVAPGGNNTVSVQNPAMDPCQTNAHTYTPISITTAANTKIVTGTSAKKTYVCSLFLFSAGADNIAVVEGTGTNCATGPAGVIGGSTATNGLNLVANQGLQMGAGAASVAATVTNADDLCLITSAAVVVAGHVVWAQQ